MTKNKILRRRGSLKPIEAPSDDRELENDPFGSFGSYGLFSTPCVLKVSNDPLSLEDIQGIEPCDLKLFECFESNGIDPDIAVSVLPQLDVEFDYELHYLKGGDFALALSFLEDSMLQHLAAVFGLLRCGPRRDLRRLQTTKNLRSLVLGVGSEPSDIPDPDFATCIVPVESSVSAVSTCQPVTGFLTVFVDPSLSLNDRALLLTMMLRLVRDGMGSDSFVSGLISKVSFIGTRTTDTRGGTGAQVQEDVSITEHDSNDRFPSFAIWIVCVAGVLAFVLIGFLVRARRKRRKQRRKLEEEDVWTIELPNELGVVVAPPPKERSHHWRELLPSQSSSSSPPLNDLISPMTTDSITLPPPIPLSRFEKNEALGSMAAKDTLALKPQQEYEDDDASSETSIVSLGKLLDQLLEDEFPSLMMDPTAKTSNTSKNRIPDDNNVAVSPAKVETVALGTVAENTLHFEAFHDDDVNPHSSTKRRALLPNSKPKRKPLAPPSLLPPSLRATTTETQQTDGDDDRVIERLNTIAEESTESSSMMEGFAGHEEYHSS